MAHFAVSSAQESLQNASRTGHLDGHSKTKGSEMSAESRCRPGESLTMVVPNSVVTGEDGSPKEPQKFTLRQQWYLLLEDPDSSCGARAVSHFILYTIVASIACFVLETLPSLRGTRGAAVFAVVELVTTIVFSAEYLSRFIVCDAFPATCYGHQSKFAFLRNPLNILDLLAISPFYLELAAAETMKSAKQLRVLRAVRLIRCFRIFKLSKYSLGVSIMVESVLNSLQPLIILTFFLGIGVVLTSSLMYYAERTGCPNIKAMIANNMFASYEKDCYDTDTGWTSTGELLCCNKHGSALDFQSIYGSFWWSVVTMTTVGYGDHVPRTLPGKLVGCLAMLSGIVLISLPVAIVGSKFQLAYESIEEEKKQILAMDEAVAYQSEGADSSNSPRRERTDLLYDVAQAEKQDEEKKEKKKKNSPPAPSGETADDPQVPPFSGEFTAQLNTLRGRLKGLEDNDKLSDKSLDELYLLLEMFDHVERIEKQLRTLREKDATLDASIRKEFTSLSKAYDSSFRAQVSS